MQGKCMPRAAAGPGWDVWQRAESDRSLPFRVMNGTAFQPIPYQHVFTPTRSPGQPHPVSLCLSNVRHFHTADCVEQLLPCCLHVYRVHTQQLGPGPVAIGACAAIQRHPQQQRRQLQRACRRNRGMLKRVDEQRKGQNFTVRDDRILWTDGHTRICGCNLAIRSVDG